MLVCVHASACVLVCVLVCAHLCAGECGESFWVYVRSHEHMCERDWREFLGVCSITPNTYFVFAFAKKYRQLIM